MSSGARALASDEPVFWTPILYDVAHAFESVEDPELRVDRVLALMHRFVPYERCALLEASPVLARPISIVPEPLPGKRAALTERLQDMLTLLSERSMDEGRDVKVANAPGCFHLAVPIIGLGETTGVVFVERPALPYDQSHLAFLSVIAAQIGAYLAAVRADRELRASESRFRKIYESGMIGIAFLDPDGTIADANDTFAASLQRSRATLQGASWHDMTPREHHACDRAAFAAAIERGRCRPYEKQFTRENGERITVMAGAACIESTDLLVAFVLDVTEQKRVETERAGLLEERESDLEFLEMFMGMLGHDLRNPLGAIRMSAELLAMSDDAQARSKSASRILSSSRRMERMVDQLLDLTRIRLAGGMLVEPRRLDLRELCSRTIDELTAANPDATVRMEVSGDVTGEWDGDRLLQVVSNLLGNAIQHADGDAEVTLRLAGDGDEVRLSTHNPGAIPAELLPVIFDPFRGSQQTGNRQGLGLGLFISKYIVEAHGGTIEVESSSERGTTFTARLPRRAGGVAQGPRASVRRTPG